MAIYSTIANQVRTARLTIFSIGRIIHSTLIDSFVAARSLGASRRLMKYLQCGLRYAWWIRFGPVPLSTKQVAKYNTDLFSAISIWTLYVGLAKRRLLSPGLRTVPRVLCSPGVWLDVLAYLYGAVCSSRFRICFDVQCKRRVLLRHFVSGIWLPWCICLYPSLTG